MSNTGSTHQPQEGLGPFVIGFLMDRGVPRPEAFESVSIQPDGSERSFFRISHPCCDRTFILVENPPVTPFCHRENTAYLKIGQHLRAQGVPIPEIHRWDLEGGRFLVEDVGDLLLQKALSAGDHSPGLLEKVLEVLFHMQHQGVLGFDTGWCCQTPRYDRQCMSQYESQYFIKAFLCGYLGLEAQMHELDPAFGHLAFKASLADAGFFLHRDFQSRNVLVNPKGLPAVLDWQGGRVGPLGYDLASFLIDPYVGLHQPERERLYGFYLEMLLDHDPSQVRLFEETFPYLSAQRNLQILGAFGFLSKVRGKPFFETFIPAAALSLLETLWALKDPLLHPIIQVMESTRALWMETPNLHKTALNQKRSESPEHIRKKPCSN